DELDFEELSAAGIALRPGVDEDAAVAFGREAVFQLKLKVAVVALGPEPTNAATFGTKDAVVGRPIPSAKLLPPVQLLADEERAIACCRRLVGADAGDAQTKVNAQMRRRLRQKMGRRAFSADVAPTSPAQHTPGRPSTVAPFPHVAVHVIEAQAVGRIR